MYQDNALVRGAATARFRLHPVLAVVLLLLLFTLSVLLSTPLTTLFIYLTEGWQGLIGETARYGLAYLFSPFITVILVFFLWVKFVEKRSISSLGFFKEKMLIDYIKGFGFGFALMGVHVFVSYLLGVYKLEETVFNFDTPLILLSALIILPGWLIQGAAEEIMTRGLLFQATSRKHVLTGVILSSSIFALLHLINNGVTPLVMLNLILYGLFASSYALYKENLWSICAFHSAWNWAQGNVFGISVSGNSMGGGSVMVSGQAHGLPYMTGGTFGAEGSIIITVMMLVATVYFFYKTYQKTA